MITLSTEEKCPHCGANEWHFLSKLIPATQYSKLRYAPKYLPQIKQVCAKCKQWLRFATQTDELIDTFNQAEEESVNE